MDGPTPQPTDETPAQPPVDQGWNDFVQKNAQPQQPQQADPSQPPAQDPKWNDFVQSHKDQAIAPPEPEKTTTELGTALAKPILDFASSVMLPKAPEQPSEYDKTLDKDLDAFRSSQGYKEGAASFMNVVNDAVLKPAVEAYSRQGELAVQAWQDAISQSTPKDQYGNAQPETVEDAINRTMALPTAFIASASAAIGLSGIGQQTFTPLAQKLFPNDPDAQKAYAEGMGQQIGQLPAIMEGMRGPHPTDPAIQLRNAQRASIFEGQDAYLNEPIKTTETPIKQEVQEQVPAEQTAPAAPPATPDVHAVARQLAPDIMGQYDKINDRQEDVRTQLSDLSAQRTKALDDQIQAIRDAKEGGYGKLQSLMKKREDILAAGDTPEMQQLRQQLQSLDLQKRNLAPEVPTAYRAAQAHMPPEVAPETVETQQTPQVTAETPQVEGQKLQVAHGEQAGSLDIGSQLKGKTVEPAPQGQLSLEGSIPPRIDIADDVSRKLVASGRPADEAQASGQVVAKMYQYFSDIYGGAKGTDEDFYRKFAPDITKSNRAGKILGETFLNGTSTLIRLAKKANASTFVHEAAHHFLDMMDRFSKEDGAPQKLLDDMQKIREWSGLSDKVPETTREQTVHTSAQEKFARGFERYLMEGVAPTKDMADIFAKFKQWMSGIYKTLQSIPNQQGGITPDIKDFFDRVLAGSTEKTIIAPDRELPKVEVPKVFEKPTKVQTYTNVPKKPLSLSGFLKKIGGLKDEGGDALSSIGKTDRKLIRKNAGKSLDDAALRAYEAGYFKERPSIDEFLAALHEDINGTAQYSDHDINEQGAYEHAMAQNAEIDRLIHNYSIDTNGKSSDQIWDEIAEHMSVEKRAKEVESMTEAFEHEMQTAEKSAPKAESLEPEELEKEAVPRTQEDLENERKQEADAGGAQTSATGTSGPEYAGRSEEPLQEGAGQRKRGIESSGRDSEAGPATARTSGSGEAGGTSTRNAVAESERTAGYSEGQRANVAGTPAGGQSYFVDKGGRFRLDKFNTSQDAMAALKEMVAQNMDFLDARSGTDAYKQAQLIRANKQLLAQLAESFVKARELAKGTPEDMAAYLRISEQMQIAGRIRAELQADWGHAGHALQEVTRTEGVEDVDALVRQVTGKTLFQLEEEARLMEQLPTPEKQAQFADDMRTGKWRKFEDGTIALFRNSILSNPITHAAYTVGNYVTAMTRAIATKGIAALLSGDVSRFGEVPRAVAALHIGIANALPVAAAALRSGVPFMRGSVGPLVQRALYDVFAKMSEDRLNKIASGDMGLLKAAQDEALEKGVKIEDINPSLALKSADSRAAQAQRENFPAIHAYLENAATGGYQEYKPSLPGAIGNALTWPERSLAAIHTVSYAMNFEMEIASSAFQSALKKGLTGDDMNIHIARYTQSPPVDVMEAAHDQSLRAVFMSRPKYGGLQQLITKAIHNDIPVVRVITNTAIPFVQIGMNILEQGFVEHTPLGFLKQSIRDDLMGKNGDIARQTTAAKMIVGSGMGAAAFGMAAAGFMTGGGPADYKQRAVLEATGWKAYSAHVGDLYLPYKKWLGPMGPVMGACADLQEVAHLLHEDDTKHATQAISAMFADNVADETWMNGLSELVGAFHDQGVAWKHIENVATGFVPYSAAVNQVEKVIDPNARLTRSNGPENLWGLKDKVQSRIPGLSYMLPAKVNVFGDPIPSSTLLGPSHETNDELAHKISDIGAAIAQAPNQILGIHLNNQQYSEFSVTSGVLIRENLSWILQDPSFDEMSHGAKIKQISQAVKQAREAASQDIMFRYPEIMDKATENKEKAELQ